MILLCQFITKEFQPLKGNLTWDQRLVILRGTCRALAYLHGGDPPLVHQDIKSYVLNPANV